MSLDINLLQLITGVFVGAASGYLGSYMVLRRMALVGDALSHVALPGIALGILLGINPFVGAFTTLFLGIVGIWIIENRTELSTESLVGLFFTFSLSVGILITPKPDLLEALFGDISKITKLDTAAAISLSLLVIIIMHLISKRFILSTLLPDLAKSRGIKVSIINFIFLLLVAFIVALGIKAVGTLLMGALVIIPAIAAKNFSKSMTSYAFMASVIGASSLVIGVIVSNLYHLPPGPMVVLVSVFFFLVSLLKK